MSLTSAPYDFVEYIAKYVPLSSVCSLIQVDIRINRVLHSRVCSTQLLEYASTCGTSDQLVCYILAMRKEAKLLTFMTTVGLILVNRLMIRTIVLVGDLDVIRALCKCQECPVVFMIKTLK
jgi:hypothetical protein